MSSPRVVATLHQLHVGGFTLSRHARERKTEFGIVRADLETLLTNPQVRYESPPRRPGCQTFVYQHGEWSAIVDETDRRVVTIVRRKAERWEH